MKYYKDNQNNVYAYELDGSQDHLIGDKVAMTTKEVDIHLNPIISQSQRLEQKKADATAYLSDTDWITAKYVDLVVVSASMTKSQFLKQYQDIYTKRAEARAILNEA